LRALTPDHDLFPDRDPLANDRDLGGFNHFDREFGEVRAVTVVPTA